MSDDTPTQRLPETPDSISPADPTDPADPAAGELAEERKKSRALLFTLIGVGAALLVAIIVLLALLLPRGGDPQAVSTTTSSPSASDTPSATPTASDTPSATPDAPDEPAPSVPPADTAPGFASFSQGETVSCNTTNPPGYTPPQVSFTYTSKNASSVWFVLGTGDAADAGAFPMPLSGNQNDVYDGPLEYPCPQASQSYTLTVVGQSGQHVSKTFTVTNTGDTQ